VAATSGEGIGRRHRGRAQGGDIGAVRQQWRVWAKDGRAWLLAASGRHRLRMKEMGWLGVY
jgi:hypothetical protein